MIIIMKFGGTSLKDGAKIRNAAGLVKQNLKGNRPVTVVSAIDGVTEILIELSEEAGQGKIEFVKTELKNLRNLHENCLINAVKESNLRSQISGEIADLFQELELVLMGVISLKEITLKTRDRVLSFGERLCALIFTQSLIDQGIQAKCFTGLEAGIITNDDFGEANPLMEFSKIKIQKLSPLLDSGTVPVVTGFIGGTQGGEITTLGRGGSDYTASILGLCLKADEVWLWTDVDGIMTADPRIVQDACVIPELSYDEAMEMSVFGAKSMHPRALEPTKDVGIPVMVRNTFNPNVAGTRILGDNVANESNQAVKSVAVMGDVGIVGISGGGMVGKSGIAARVFDILARNSVNLLMISQSASESNITIVVKKNTLYKTTSILEVALLGKSVVKEVTSEDDVSVVAVLGAGMSGTRGVAARVFQAVSKNGINVRMIAQGSSELSISFVVKEKEARGAALAVHKEFCLGS